MILISISGEVFLNLFHNICLCTFGRSDPCAQAVTWNANDTKSYSISYNWLFVRFITILILGVHSVVTRISLGAQDTVGGLSKKILDTWLNKIFEIQSIYESEDDDAKQNRYRFDELLMFLHKLFDRISWTSSLLLVRLV